MKITSRIKKALSVFSAVAAIGCMAAGASVLSASAACNICYTCDESAWVRSTPEYSDNIIGQIPQYSVIQVTDTDGEWGLIEYEDTYGATLIGWTELDSYTPLLLDDDYSFIEIPDDIKKSADKKTIYAYLAGEMSLNEAAADAAMVNIGCESRFNPEAYTIDTNGLPSFGLCQWNGERYDRLMKFCSENGLDCNDADSQMKYLEYEFQHGYSTQYETLLNTENSASGCYDASWYWASRFEVCSSQYWEERTEQAYYYYMMNQ